MKRMHLLAISLLALYGVSQTQVINLSGRVVNENSVPIPNASVSLENAGTATTTDANGLFNLSSNSIVNIPSDRLSECVVIQNGVMHVKANGTKNGEIAIYDCSGKKASTVFVGSFQEGDNAFDISDRMNGLANAIYILKVNIGGRSVLGKFYLESGRIVIYEADKSVQKGFLAKAMAAGIDNLRVSASGYRNASLDVEEYDMGDLGDIVLSSCFPPITDFTVRDGGFGSAQREKVTIGTGDQVSLFRPADENFGQDGCKHPVLVWGNGHTNTIDIWAGHLSRAASFGFVVVGPEQTSVSAGHMNDALDYVIELSQDPNSDYYNKVDVSKLGSTGYSMGGMGAMQVAANSRIGATFIWDSFGTASALHGPLGGIFADPDSGGIGGNWQGMIDDCPSPYPAFGMEAAGTNHTSILMYPSGSTPYAQEAYVAWFRWHFMGDPAAEALFVGDDCGFCKRDGITVHQNNMKK